jgi:hypothetical protein
MRCKDARKAIVLARYEELGPAEKAKLEAHLQTCEACVKDRDETEAVLKLISAHGGAEVPACDSAKAWDGVRRAIAGAAHAPRASLAAWRRFVPSVAVLAAVLAAGVLIGRFALRRGHEPRLASVNAEQGTVGGAALPAESLRPVLSSYLEDLSPILLDFAHSSGNGAPGRSVQVDERLLRGLLLQNMVLRRALNGSDPAAADLLDDLDLVLKEIINGKGPGGASPAQVRDLISERGILFRMQILKTS